jgi:hypothetical protein
VNSRSKKQVEIGIQDSVSGMFAQYFKACYPNGCPSRQHDEIKQAFYSGTFSLLAVFLSDKMPENDEERAIATLESMYQECERVLKARLNSNG